jgi:type IV fimbrial biogenesis protein FimT
MPSPKEAPMNTTPIRRQRGFSLVEATVTTALSAILAGLAVPSFEQARVQRHLEGAAAQLETDIHFARSLAVARNEGVRISFAPAADASCYVIHTGAAGDCSCGTGAEPVCTGTAQALRTVRYDGETPLQMRSNSRSMLFDPVRGTTTPTATVRVEGRDGSAIHQIVNIMGRVRSCSPTLPGYRRC